MGKRLWLFPVPSAIARWLAVRLHREALFIQLYGSLQIDGGEAQKLLGWSGVQTAADGLRQAGREFANK